MKALSKVLIKCFYKGLFILMSTCISQVLIAQDKQSINKDTTCKYIPFVWEEEEEPPIFFIPEDMPEFPGGEEGFSDYFKKNLEYPVEAQDMRFKGRVYVGFVIDSLGGVGNIKIARGVHPLLDREAIRVTHLMPQWKPGIHEGEKISMSYILPITFSMDSLRNYEIIVEKAFSNQCSL